ncbi:16S rRNA (cytidine(1402)-2'-O)-methyltransferase [Desulfonauticus submarinus]|uniref:Ribosomal RNA small subunit methyltransferase I n=1 Tax=Desulfonauticus submarinus TaxID=206665 RepID=A0A1H0DX80_9BACT|nr:16S rRNA (cytidine(1402)-2'-O)-methyltransferase [Desulfonauticus submarinus]SDN74636.1 16S rRNA (cytidine1402-2'-O)-methyltransferase [Desulfonauticus submarinus]
MSRTSGKGRLFIVATPLGNLGDITFRAIDVLKNVDKVLAEDTRSAKKLFHALKIPLPSIESFFDQNEKQKLSLVKAWLKNGLDIALISEAGTPLISDPGFLLIKKLREDGFPIIPIPGPSAPITALIVSGFPPLPHTFLGFLPRKAGEIRKIFANFMTLPCTLIFFERKNRVLRTLKIAYEVLGKREFCLARELTKIHEEVIYGRLDDINLDESCLRGEITVLIAPPTDFKTSLDKVKEKIYFFKESNLKAKDIIKIMQQEVIGWSNKELYELIISELKH